MDLFLRILQLSRCRLLLSTFFPLLVSKSKILPDGNVEKEAKGGLGGA